ncbi:MAG: hypothetical protein ACI94Z_000667 [Yoonia sp.]|jgi:hypothetical protein
MGTMSIQLMPLPNTTVQGAELDFYKAFSENQDAWQLASSKVVAGELLQGICVPTHKSIELGLIPVNCPYQ